MKLIKLIKSIMHFLFSDCEPRYVMPETGEVWDDYCDWDGCFFQYRYRYCYVAVKQSRLGVWKKGGAFLGKNTPLPRYSK